MSEIEDGCLSYKGIDEAVLIHALYHGTRALGLGHLHDNKQFSLEDAKAVVGKDSAGRIFLDYVAGRPLKVSIDTNAKTFFYRLYDRDAGNGAAGRIVAELLSR